MEQKYLFNLWYKLKARFKIGKMSDNTLNTDKIRIKKPKWLRVKLPTGENYKKVRSLVEEHKLHTICESGNCPNM